MDPMTRRAFLKRTAHAGAAAGAMAAAVPGAALGAQDPMDDAAITVRPTVSDDVLPNPHLGWETFHRTRPKDQHLPEWIPSTVHYARWGWGTLEPEPGRLDTGFLDGVLAETRAAGQTLAFRVMCCSTSRGRPYHPAWLKEVGGKELVGNYSDTADLVVPDLDHPAVLDRHLDFIRRLGARYDGHADIDHVDLGSVGWWGEWHMSSSKQLAMPTADTCRRVVDAYLAAFRKTPLLMLVGGKEMLTYACRRGAGWRADCLGDLGGFSKTWCHMRKGYPLYVKEAGIADAWKTGPVAWESCWDMRRWVSEGWPLRFIFNYALAYHGSYLNNKSAPLPPGDPVRDEILRFLRRLGYRFALRELRHPASVRPGGTLEVASTWQNVGSAPCYRPYRVAYRLDAGGQARVLVGAATVAPWMAGEVTDLGEKALSDAAWEMPAGPDHPVRDRVAVPADLAAGTYRLSAGIVGPDGTQPRVRLAIDGRDEEGWYPLSRVRVAG